MKKLVLVGMVVSTGMFGMTAMAEMLVKAEPSSQNRRRTIKSRFSK